MPVRPETRARALALQLLYAWDVTGALAGASDPTWTRAIGVVRAGPRAEERALALAGRVVERRPDIDARIAAAADRWRLERIGVVERAILRLGVDELEAGETPPRVVITEMVRLARWFGGEKSPSFVNGVLDRVARDLGRL